MGINLMVVLGFDAALRANAMESAFAVNILLGIVAAWVLVAVAAEGGKKRRITAFKQCDVEGHPKVFALSLGGETVTLEPGRSWAKVDAYKWITRGIIEEPQSFHILPNGAVEINTERIGLEDPDGAARLEHEINKHHAAPDAHKTPGQAQGARALSPQGPGPRPDKVHFKVKLDHLGHMMLECTQGAERVETSLRGLPMLIQNGLMLRPKDVHVDPLQRAVEIDGIRFECSEAGAHQLERELNARYAPSLQSKGESAIEVNENPAASTGFDIRFVTIRAGMRFEIHGHLSQENLDILQDPGKCELLQPGILLRLSPPYLLIRRRRPDGGEARLAELPDLQYRRTTARQLQEVLNHPLIRRNLGKSERQVTSKTAEQPSEIVTMRLVRNPENKLLLWLECTTSHGEAPDRRAFTHHNIADLQHGSAFRTQCDVSLELDNRTLRILDKETNREDSISVDPKSPDEDLTRASQILTAALKPPTVKPAATQTMAKTESPPADLVPPTASQPTPGDLEPRPLPHSAGEQGASSAVELPESVAATSIAKETADQTEPAQRQAAGIGASYGDVARKVHEQLEAPSFARAPASATEKSREGEKTFSAGSREVTQITTPQESPADESVLALFHETDSVRINTEIFRELAARLGLPIQAVCLTLPRVFENRRFDVISLNHFQVNSVLELRSGEFRGFYLAHISDERVVLVYACDGKHIEWGSVKCELQAAMTVESDEFKGSALLGMALDPKGHFVFVVDPAYKEWAKAREKTYAEANAGFITVKDLAATPRQYSLIWPKTGHPADTPEPAQPRG